MNRTKYIFGGIVVITLASLGCSSGETSPPATGGAKATGGTNASGGAKATGGTNASGGAKATGGAKASGGSTASGGTANTGGTKASGGTRETGGSSATGGTDASGGNPASGGAKASGGAIATGGQVLASGGAVQTGGTSATGGTPATGGIPATGGQVAVDAGPPDTTPPDASVPFTCNLVIGNTTTQQWFDGGFLTYPGIDKTRWELRMVGHHYISSWANASDSGWSAPLTAGQACAKNSTNPDRVIFIATQPPPYPSAATYQGHLTNIVKNIKAKYSNVKQIELTTLIRSPGNLETACSNKSGNEQNIPPAEDQGIAAVAADPAFAGMVVALPPFYVTACSDFLPDAPQYTDLGATHIAKVYGEYYASHP